MTMSPLESERQNLLSRLNEIDGQLSGLSKQGIAQAARLACRGLNRDLAKAKGATVRAELGDKRRALVEEKNRLTSRYIIVKGQLRHNAAAGGGQGPTLDLLTEIRDLLRTIAEAHGEPVLAAKSSGPPRVRNTE